MKMKKVLVVDDNNDILTVVRLLLEMEGYDVCCIDTGYQILDTIFQYQPNLILLDVMLGDLDGREICKSLKSTPAVHHIPIIMISASHNVDTKAYQADGFIAKPFDIELLAKTVYQHVA